MSVGTIIRGDQLLPGDQFFKYRLGGRGEFSIRFGAQVGPITVPDNPIGCNFCSPSDEFIVINRTLHNEWG